MAITLPNEYNTYVPLDTLLASQLNSDNANNKYMFDNFPQAVVVAESMTNTQIESFFNGSYSQSFTIPVDGTWELHTPFSVVAHRASANVNSLVVLVDGTPIMRYVYASETADSEWGMSRRTISGIARVLTLTSGVHTITTSGNLYYESSSGGVANTSPQIYLTRLAV